MKWKRPHISKIYEALSSVVDDRVELNSSGTKVYSSSRNKFYNVVYDPERNAIMSNDNSSYWQGNLGYPSIAYLLKMGILPYDQELASLLRGILWKDINQKFKNNFDKSLEYILSNIESEQIIRLKIYVENLDNDIIKLSLNLLGKKTLPPEGY